VAQWAQDNAKAGLVPAGDAVLVPRFASRRDDGSMFVPGESSLVESFSRVGIETIHSPLVFQGGNMIAVLDAAASERVLLVGEAEVHRNTALGLSVDQVRDALAVETGVDRCVVLPSVSFHIDYDVTVRRVDDAMVAFVNDPPATARRIVALAVDALADAGRLSADEASTARQAMDAGEGLALHRLVGGRLREHANPQGHYPLSLANLFADGPADSPTGNLQRVLTALDLLAALDRSADGPANPQVRSYLAAFRRTEADRAELHGILRDLGWRVVAVPGLPEATRGIVYVNGIHDRTRYVMPAYGGFFAPLDAEAADAFRGALGPDVAVVPVLCGESQRRSGAVHCAASGFLRR
jgi:hypothetical protein